MGASLQSSVARKRRRQELSGAVVLSSEVKKLCPNEWDRCERLRELERGVEERVVGWRRRLLASSGRVWRRKTLRVWVHTSISADSGAWEIGLEGALLEPSPGQNQRFSNFLERMTVVLDDAVFPLGPVYDWYRKDGRKEVDGFKVAGETRRLVSSGQRRFSYKVYMQRRVDAPPRCALSPAIKKLLRLPRRPTSEPLSVVLDMLLQYCQERNLLQREEGSGLAVVMCDAPLQQALGVPSVRWHDLGSQLQQQHLLPPESLSMEGVLNMDRPSVKERFIDVEVDVLEDVCSAGDEPAAAVALMGMLDPEDDSEEAKCAKDGDSLLPKQCKTLQVLDGQVEFLTRAINARAREVACLRALAEDPLGFVARAETMRANHQQVLEDAVLGLNPEYELQACRAVACKQTS